MTTLIYCRAGEEIGMGHAVRCGHLARVLQDAGEPVRMMAVNTEPVGAYFKNLGLPVLFGADEMLADIKIHDLADRWIVDVMVNDDKLLRRIRPFASQLIVIVGVGYSITRDTHWIADQVVYQAPTSKWKGIPGETVIAGLDHIIIDPAYAEEPEDERELDSVVYFGGGFSPDARQALQDLMYKPKDKYLDNWPDGVVDDMRRAKFYVGSMGMAVYEALASDAFPIVVCRSEDHIIPARRLESQGRLVYVGILEETSPERLFQIYRELLGKKQFLKPRSVDGLGVYRVARKILEWQPPGR